MSGTIDTLQVVFTADTARLTAGLTRISAQLTSIDGLADAASASLAGLGSALDFGMSDARDGAYSAGAGIGSAFASGISSMKEKVEKAARALAYTAVSALNLSGYPEVSAVSFAPSDMAPAAGGHASAGTAPAAYGGNVVIPINLDGVKLGEACIKALGQVSGMTGRARLSI